MHQSLSDQNTDRQSAILPHPQPGLPDFFVAYGQNPDKKWTKWLFFEKVMAKTTKCFNYCNFHTHRCLKLFGRQYIFCQKNVVLPNKQVFTLKQQFLL